ncbi:MAG: sigma-70 family RNA polymerase sigma factor [Planctomycetes bacterium]|nr:sigma-70 family RNA polymerase sigma factor [Planctomycetota bacterium]
MSETRPDFPAEALLAQGGFLRALAQGLLSDEHASEDVVQTAWLHALEHRGDQPRLPRAWLARVVQNLAWKRRRSEERRAAREAAVSRDEAVEAETSTVEHADTLRAVTDAVLALDEPYRAVILQRYFEGLELAEIAARSREPLATVRSRHTRALALLRERLDRAHGGERGAWVVGLVALVGGERSGLVGAGLGIGTVTSSALIVSSKLKLVVAAALAVAALLAVWFGVQAASRGATDPASRAPALAAPLPPPNDGSRELASSRAASDDSGADASSARTPIATSGSLVVRVAWSDGTPAAGVALNAMQWAATDPFLAQRYAFTDVRGEARIAELAPGLVGIYADRGAYASAAVRAGEEAQAELALASGLTVHGRVVDLAGAPVANAEIWLSAVANGSQGVAVGASDSNGRFELRDIADGNGVGARLAGFAPSPTLWPHGSAGEAFELRLVLQGPGAALAVRIVDPEGKPVRGARVSIAEREFRREGYGPHEAPQYPIPLTLESGADGTCVALGLTPGTADVVVGSTELAPWQGSVELHAGATDELSVALVGGVAVQGVVRDSDGVPLEGVRVAVGSYGDLSTRAVESRADGRYRLIALAPGDIAIKASLRDAGFARTTLRGEDGDELAWDPVLDAGRVVRGRVVDERGVALSNWSVDAEPDGRVGSAPGFQNQTQTDSEGRFRLINCPDQALTLAVHEPGSVWAFAAIELPGVLAGEDELLIQVPDDRRATAWLEGRVLGLDGKPTAAELRFASIGSRRAHTSRSDAATGAFRVGPFAPGALVIEALGAGSATARLTDVEVAPGETLDVGTLRLGGVGRVQIVLAPVDGIDPERVHVDVLTPEGRVVRSLSGADLAGAIELARGRYVLDVYGDIVPESTDLSIAPGESTRVELTPRRAVVLTFVFRLPEGRSAPFDVEFAFHPTNGGATYTTRSEIQHLDQVPARYANFAGVRVPPAEAYSVVVTGPDGLRGSVELGADELRVDAARAGEPIEIVLR